MSFSVHFSEDFAEASFVDQVCKDWELKAPRFTLESSGSTGTPTQVMHA